MKKIAVIIYGPPGSGKGTQATFIANQFGLVHFDTGRFLESVVHDPARQRERAVKSERKLFDGGKLLTPSWVLGVVRQKVKEFARAGMGVVFSGSPRTMYEARGLFPVLEKLYKKKNIFIFILAIPPAVSLKRNSARVVCSVCKAPLLTQYYPSAKPKHCPTCGGAFYKRTLDNPATITIRLEEYRQRTEPIFAFTRTRGYALYRIDGRPAPYKVFQNIARRIR